MVQRFFPEEEGGYRTESSQSLSKGTDFIANRVWRSSRLEVLSKVVEVVVKVIGEEIGRFTGDMG